MISLKETTLGSGASNPSPSPADIVAFLPHACRQLQAPFNVKIHVKVIDQNTGSSDKTKYTRRQKSESQDISEVQMDSDKLAFEECGNDVCVRAGLSAAGHLLELEFARTAVPSLLLKIVALCVPFHTYLNKITIKRGVIDYYTVKELATMLPQCNLTEVCLDDSPVPHRCYSLLLMYQTGLRCLSLDRCRLDDDDCIEIAQKLAHPHPASHSLLVLSMGSNLICDSGAIALASMLRSNRKLHHLNLAGNLISDTGVGAILSCLRDFRVEYGEILSKRLRTIQHVKLRKDTRTSCKSDMVTTLIEKKFDERCGSRKKVINRRKSAVSTTASLAANERSKSTRGDEISTRRRGSNDEPFSGEDMFSEEGYLYSKGNMSLCYLNISYNNMGYESVVKLVEVLRYQKERGTSAGRGLVRVVVEGNPLPRSSLLLTELQALCDHLPACAGKPQVKTEKLASRSKR